MIPELVTIHTSLLTDLGDAVRAKTGGSEEMTLADMATAVEGIEELSVIKKGSDTYKIQIGNSYFDMQSGILYKSESNSFVFNPSTAQQSLRVIHRFKKGSNIPAWKLIYGNGGTNGSNGVIAGFDGSSPQRLYCCNTTSYKYFSVTPDNDKWYYVVGYTDIPNMTNHYYLYADDGTLLDSQSVVISSLENITSYHYMFTIAGQSAFGGYIDLSSCCYEKDGVVLWGQLTSKTRTMGIPT